MKRKQYSILLTDIIYLFAQKYNMLILFSTLDTALGIMNLHLLFFYSI